LTAWVCAPYWYLALPDVAAGHLFVDRNYVAHEPASAMKLREAAA
jgi:hypothetical protein